MSTDNRAHQIDLIDWDADCDTDGHAYDGDDNCLRCEHQR